MMIRISGGRTDNGIVFGNAFDKYGSSNPIVKHIMSGFHNALNAIVTRIAPRTIHEVGCGEGYWVIEWSIRGISARGSDFSNQVIDIAQSNAKRQGIDPDRFQVRSIYEVTPEHDRADLIVCCEVMEHLEAPERALSALQRIVTKDLVLSVPREPLWRVLNVARGKYLSDLGNTPGHVQHWSTQGIVSLAARYFDIVEIRSPLPWTMIQCKPKQP